MDSVALSVKLFEIFGFESGRRKFEGREKEKDMKAVIFYVASILSISIMFII